MPKFSITVPSRPGTNAPADFRIDHDQAVLDLMYTLSGLCGGATAIPAFGAWKDANGKLVTENVTIVYTFGEEKTTSQIRGICAHLCDELKQDCILLEVDGKHEFVEVVVVGATVF